MKLTLALLMLVSFSSNSYAAPVKPLIESIESFLDILSSTTTVLPRITQLPLSTSNASTFPRATKFTARQVTEALVNDISILKHILQPMYTELYNEAFGLFINHQYITRKQAIEYFNIHARSGFDEFLKVAFKEEYALYAEKLAESTIEMKYVKRSKIDITELAKLTGDLAYKQCKNVEVSNAIKAEFKSFENAYYFQRKYNKDGYIALSSKVIKKELNAELKTLKHSLASKLPAPFNGLATFYIDNIKITSNDVTLDVGEACGYKLSLKLHIVKSRKDKNVLKVFVNKNGIAAMTPHLNRHILNK